MDLPEHYPAYSAELIRTIVTVAHFDLNKLRDLVAPHPQLVKASWDWGFGDWETPLGAACHMGRRDIAEYLLSLGSVPTLFSAILFGELSTVREALEKSPALARVSGPHSISLLAHARTAGQPSREVMSYLESLGDADIEKPVPLGEEDKNSICGSYRFGGDSSQVVTVSGDMATYAHTPMYTLPPQLNWTRAGTISRPLFHMGQRQFYPAGAPSVRIAFEIAEKATVMKIADGETVLEAARVDRV